MGTTGLLIVHGIGEQHRGETVEKFINEFCAARPDAGCDQQVEPRTLTAGEATIRLYEP